MEQIKEKQNSFSFRWGGTSTDIKMYFEDALDLKRQLEEMAVKSNEFKKAIDTIRGCMRE
tara:strand:- start:892 stop:1071 length:180 start_codon:yes stop_codon:yes gene_type:complete